MADTTLASLSALGSPPVSVDLLYLVTGAVSTSSYKTDVHQVSLSQAFSDKYASAGTSANVMTNVGDEFVSHSEAAAGVFAASAGTSANVSANLWTNFSPISSVADPDRVALFVGQEYLNTSSNTWFKAFGFGSADWVALN